MEDMDLSEFKNLFISEVQENLKSIDGALAQLRQGYSKEAVDNLHRYFHTLKGISSTMGYERFFQLSKSLNDLAASMALDASGYSEDVFLLFADGKDKLLYGLGLIIDNNPDGSDFGEFIEKVRQRTGS
jgi:two-component system, chemotaxis family, sensor kinase CheA